MNMPAHKLCDLFATILAKDVVRYIAWEKCISRDQETTEEPESKGLKLSKDGMLMQDVAPDSHTNLSGEFLWDYAMRRRSLAADISGLLRFETADKWTETLKQYLLKTPPPGHKKVGWFQIKSADEALWNFVQRKCEITTKAQPGADTTAFELAWKEGMFDYDVRQHLSFLQGPSSSTPSSTSVAPFVPSSASAHDQTIQKLTNRLKNAQEQITAQRRRQGGQVQEQERTGPVPGMQSNDQRQERVLFLQLPGRLPLRGPVQEGPAHLHQVRGQPQLCAPVPQPLKGRQGLQLHPCSP